MVSDMVMILYCYNEYQAFKAVREVKTTPQFIVRHKEVVYGTFVFLLILVIGLTYTDYLVKSGMMTSIDLTYLFQIIIFVSVIVTLPIVS